MKTPKGETKQKREPRKQPVVEKAKQSAARPTIVPEVKASTTFLEQHKRRVGRPTKYDPKYCAELKQHMADGYTLECFVPSDCYVTDVTIDFWLRSHPEFLDAKKEGERLGAHFWLSLGRAGAAGRLKNFNAAAWIFTMKNCYRWRDRHDIQHSGPGGGPIQTVQHSSVDLGKLTTEELRTLRALQKKASLETKEGAA